MSPLKNNKSLLNAIDVILNEKNEDAIPYLLDFVDDLEREIEDFKLLHQAKETNFIPVLDKETAGELCKKYDDGSLLFAMSADLLALCHMCIIRY